MEVLFFPTAGFVTVTVSSGNGVITLGTLAKEVSVGSTKVGEIITFSVDSRDGIVVGEFD